MPIAPRFRRVAALQRPFLDRETVLAAFDEELAQLGGGPRVLNLTGVGGIGKSRLLRHLEDRARPAHRTATLDLQVPALRQHEDALAVLRVQFGEQDVDFDRFDIAYAVLWQRLHPHLRLTRAELPFVEASSVLSEIVDSVSGVPVFGTAIGLLKLLDRATEGRRLRRRMHRDPTLDTLDDLGNAELSDAATYLFAQDLNAAAEARPYVLFVDTYEALVPHPTRSGRNRRADGWLRDLLGQLDGGLSVVGGREPLGWEAYDADWADVVRVVRVDGLPLQARLDLLAAGGIDDRDGRMEIARVSAGLPFYLNLAVDTYQQTGRAASSLVSREEILGRFLEHVSPDEVGSLEILSPTRVFDVEIFRTLADRFRLPGHGVAWSSLTAYSFVYPAGAGLRFHQLMREALGRRLSPEATTEIHGVLRGIWDGRAAAAGQPGEDTARALREASFHAVRVGRVEAAELLDYADRAVAAGGLTAANGLIEDLRQHLAEDAPADVADLRRALAVLEAETALRQGDAAAALTAVGAGDPAVLDEVGSRRAVAEGNGQRIAGRTDEALRAFLAVWERGVGAARLSAGLWAADLQMCQGRFLAAEELAAELETLAPAGSEIAADVARLRHLACRFAFDFDGATEHLREAQDRYAAAGSAVGTANVMTNEAELLAITRPADAPAAAGLAIDAQREIGAHHELGKAFTAIAMAQLQLGELDAAEAALLSAFAFLDRAGYRSGRARAEMYQGCVLARRGHLDEAAATLRHAVTELEAADVYPTLILCAARLLERLGAGGDPSVEVSAAAARSTLQPLGTQDDLAARIDRYADRLLGDQVWSPADLYQRATARTDRSSGFYHHNVRLEVATGDVMVRIPIPGSDTMDLAIWPEPATLRAVRGRVQRVPRLLYAGGDPAFQVHEFVQGDVLDTSAPRGTRVPAHVLTDVVGLFGDLGRVPADVLPASPPGWPADGDTPGFAARLSAVSTGVHARHLAEFGELFAAVGVPADPFTALAADWANLLRRPFRLLHTDVHRKNMIVAGGATWFLDWELALVGDPVYDLAVHLHKMAYLPDEETAVIAGWRRTASAGLGAGWEADLGRYLRHERAKSAVVDTVRYTKLLAGGTLDGAGREQLLDKLAGKLAAAHEVWRVRRRPGRAEIAAAVDRWIRARGSDTR